jgi:hypothetical protein
LRENIKYRLGDREIEGLRRYYELAEKYGLVERAGPVEFFDLPREQRNHLRL